MVRAQKKMLQRFEKTNEMLTNVNTLSATRLDRATTDFKKHTTMVVDMKKDLDSIFRRIRNIKVRLAKQMPEAYDSVGVVEKSEEEDDEYDVMIRERKKRNDAELNQTNSEPEEKLNNGEKEEEKGEVGMVEEVQEATEKLE